MQLSDRILFVDDDEQIRKAFLRTFGRSGFTVDLAEDALSAMDRAEEQEYAVIATDYRMPGLNGLELTEELKALQPDATYMLISGNADLSLTLNAVNEHAMSYVIPKPWNTDELASTLRRGIELAWERRGHRDVAISMVKASRELEVRETKLRAAVDVSETCLADALIGSLELRDRQTQAACRRVAAYARTLAEAMGIRGKALQHIERGALLHDIGKIGIPDAILLKEGPLTGAEWAVMRTHPDIGAALLENIEPLRGAKAMVQQHHERWDGTGYPLGISGDAISIGSRILSVVDTLDAILSDRPYRKGRPFEVARDEIARCVGTQFDPKVVDVFLSIPKERWLEVRDNNPDSIPAVAA